MKRKVVYTIAGAGAFVAFGAWALLHGQGELQYRTAAVEKGNIQYTISATGSPNAVVTVQVGSQVSGNILALYADFNTRVTKNQLIARIDPQLFQARVDQSVANLNAARAAVVNAQAGVQKANAEVASALATVADSKAKVLQAQVAVQDAKVKLDRRVELAAQGVISREDLDTARATSDTAVAMLDAARAQQNASEENVTAAKAAVEVARTLVESAQAQVAQNQAALQQAQVDLEHTYIRAPVDGTVVARHMDVGQTVAASLQAPTIFEIAQDLTKMQVDTNVSEADVGRVKVGQTATFTVDAYPGTIFQGLISSIRQAPINVQNVVTYDAVITVSNEDLKLFPGMTANVRILVDEHDDVLRVPNAVLRYQAAQASRPQDGKGQKGVKGAGRKSAGSQTLWVLDTNNKARPVQVTLGLSDGSYTEIAGGGLQAGERVIVAAFSKKGDVVASASPLGGSQRPGGPGGPRAF